MVNRIVNTLIPIILISALVSCSSTKKTTTKRLPGYWQNQPITVDGYNNDWPSPYPNYDEKAMIGYNVTNDKDNLYITMETGDLATQLKILTQGLTVWVDKGGGEDEVMAINYPLPSNDKNLAVVPQNHGPNSRTNLDKMRVELEERAKSALLKANEYSLQGFRACNLQYPLLAIDTCGVVVRMAIDSDNELVWEAKIPFKSFYGRNQIERRDKGKPISIGFELTAIDRPKGQNTGSQGNRNSPRVTGFSPSIGIGGIGGMSMGMSPGRNRLGNSNNSIQDPAANIMEPAYKSSKTWKKCGLAFPNQL